MTDSDSAIYRNIEPDDEDSLLRLRNNASNLEFFKNPRRIAPEEHSRWFYSRITDRKDLEIVGVLSGQIIGIAFLEPFENQTCSISINVAPQHQSRGIGLELLKRVLVRAESLGYSRIEAFIHRSNTKSVSLFEKSGFIIEGNLSGFFIQYVKLFEKL